MILNYAKTKSQGTALLCMILFIFVGFGCYSSSDNKGSFSDTDGDIGGIRLEVRLQGESIPAEIDRFEVSVTGPDIPLFDSNRIAVGNSPQALGLGDLDGDGVLDVVTTNSDSSDVSILLGDGRGGFPQTGQSRIAVGDSPRALGLGDLDGDGVLDVVTANSDSNDVSILLGDGRGGVPQTGQSRIAVGDSPRALGLGDLDGDGVLDVVTANVSSNDISILLNQGNNFFFTQRRVGVGRVPSAIAVARFDDDNSDGKVDFTDFPDLVTANSGDHDISVVLNTEFLRNIMTDQKILFVTIDGRATRAFQLTLQEQIPPGTDRSFFVRAFFPGSPIPAFEGRTTADVLSPDTRIIVSLNRL